MSGLAEAIDWEQIMAQATQFVIFLSPILIVPMGFKLGAKLLNMVRNVIEDIF